MMDLGRVVFIGNCQTSGMLEAYKRAVPSEIAKNATFVASYDAATEESRRLIINAEKIVWQRTDLAAKIGEVETTAPRFFMPAVVCPFLWPNSGVEHPKNVSSPFLQGGPYPAEFGDDYLNKKIAAGVPPRAAAHDYLQVDLAAEKRVDRIAEIALNQQRGRDRACGDYDVASLIERKLSREQLFRSRGHLTTPIMQHLAEVLYTQLQAPSQFMDYIKTVRFSEFVPITELPVHPSIARTFGMEYILPDTTYQFFSEGTFTFEEWAIRYMRYEWNEDYNRAIHLSRAGKTEEAIALWENSLEKSLRSSIGRFSLAELMVQNNMARRAVRWIREAAAIEPENLHYARRARDIAAHAEREIVSQPES